MIKSTPNNRGFTVIELIVAAFVFSVTLLAVTGIFGKSVQIERGGRSAQKVQENIIFVFESMIKEIQVSEVTSANSACTATTLSIDHPIRGSITYSLSGGNLVKNGSVLNSSDVTFDTFKFCITGNGGSGNGDNQSTKGTMIASVRNVIGNSVFSADLQTTVVSRDITLELLN